MTRAKIAYRFGRRSGRRGAAFVEALIVISFLILAFVGLVFFRELYVKQLRAMRLARASMMTHAMSGCGNDNEPRQWLGIKDLGTLNAASPQTDELLATNPNAREQAPSGSGESGAILGKFKFSLNPIGSSDLSGSVNVETQSGVLGKKTGFKGNPRSRSFVTCTDPVRNDSFKAGLEYIMGIFNTDY